MGMFVSTLVPYDATGRAVNLNTEYMYRADGLKLKILRFEYYKSDNADYNWFILAPIASSNAIEGDRYKVSELYLDCPVNTNARSAVDDLESLRDDLSQLTYMLTSSRDMTDILSDYAYTYLHVDDKCIGVTAKRKLIFILEYLKSNLFCVLTKLENNDAE